ncbi:hypothetical protein HAX54_027097 [Datura stramonium]|uniref:Uncharacterized protein n=1 Tax=Datura stramonium TaxID=4076 RepID=A0ABS8V3L1_DATST|nr:hypothetical protein [Datura stramonium]
MMSRQSSPSKSSEALSLEIPREGFENTFSKTQIPPSSHPIENIAIRALFVEFSTSPLDSMFPLTTMTREVHFDLYDGAKKKIAHGKSKVGSREKDEEPSSSPPNLGSLELVSAPKWEEP